MHSQEPHKVSVRSSSQAPNLLQELAETELLKPDTGIAQRSSYTPCPIMQSQTSHRHSTQGSYKIQGAGDPLRPATLSHKCREPRHSQSQLPVGDSPNSLSRDASDIEWRGVPHRLYGHPIPCNLSGHILIYRDCRIIPQIISPSHRQTYTHFLK